MCVYITMVSLWQKTESKYVTDALITKSLSINNT